MAKEEIGNLVARVSLDGSEFQHGVGRINRQLKVIQSDFQATSEKLKSFGSAEDRLKVKSESLTRQITQQKEAIKALDLSLQESIDKKGADARATQNLQTKYNRANRDLAKMENQLKATNSELAKENSFLYKFSQDLDKTGSKMQKIGSKMHDVGRSMTFGLTLPVGGALAYGVKAYADFNNELVKMRTLLNNGTQSASTLNQEMNSLGSQSQKWAQQYGESTKEINTGTEEIIKKGYTYNQVIAAMPTLLNAARGSGDDFNTVMSNITSTLEQFNMKSKDTATMTKNTKRVADDLTYVANKTAASFDDMGVAMSYVGPVAHSVGYSLEDTAAAIGLLSNNGILADKAGTQLRMAISRMLKPTKASAAAFEKMGISTKKLKKGFYTLPQLIKTINEHTKNMTKAEKAHLVAQGFGTRSQTGMNILLTQGADKLRKLSGEEQKATGYTKKLSDQMGNTAQVHMKQLASAFQVLEQQIGEQLIPQITPLIKNLSHLVQEFGNLSDSQKKTIVHIGEFLAALGPAMLILSPVVKTVGLLGKGVGKLGGLLSSAGEDALVAEGGFDAMLGPVGLVLAGVTALGVGVAAYMKHQHDANTVNLHASDALDKQYESQNSMIDQLDKLRGQSHLTNKEFGDYLDILSKIKQTADPKTLDDLKKKLHDLQKRSGLSNQQLSTMVDLNKKLAEKIPAATSKITDQGNAIAGTTDKLKKYNAEVLNEAISKAEEQRLKAIKEHKKVQDELTKKIQETNTDQKIAANYSKEYYNYSKKSVEKQKEKIHWELKNKVLLPWQKAQLEGQLKALRGGKEAAYQRYLTAKHQYNLDLQQLDGLRKKNKVLDEADQKEERLLLQSAGIRADVAATNVEHGTSIKLIDSSIKKLSEQRDKIAQSASKAGHMTQEQRDTVRQIDGQISRFQSVKSQIEQITGKAHGMNRALGASIDKHVTIRYTQTGAYVGHSAPHLARYASGTNNAPGGMSLVGEAGSELVGFNGLYALIKKATVLDLPKGAQVIPHPKTEELMRAFKNMPKLATGGEILRKGMALVAEKGRELIKMPSAQAAPVSNNAAPMPANQAMPEYIIVNNYMDGNAVGRSVAIPVTKEQARLKLQGGRSRGVK